MSQYKRGSDCVRCTIALSIVTIAAGCQSQTNPWACKPYQEPSGYTNPPQSIFAPMPTILPAVDGTAMETDETLEAELDLLREGG